jgi:aquaporin Z
MSTLVKKYLAECFGAAVLVFVGCGSVAMGSYGSSLPIGALPIALAFGLTVTALIYSLGPVSGCHINPAVTIALWVAGRFPAAQVLGYVVSQLAGAVAGAGLLVAILSGTPDGQIHIAGLGQNGWGPGYLGQYNALSAFITEFVATAIFLVVILGATSKDAVTQSAGVAIGAALVVIIVAFLNVTGVSLNPARSLGPAVFAGGHALSQVWLFFAAPSLAAMMVGLCFRTQHH